jgi:hypothetical protein
MRHGANSAASRQRGGRRDVRLRWGGSGARRGFGMTFDHMVADRVTDLALDGLGAKTDDAGTTWFGGDAQALADLEHGALHVDALAARHGLRCFDTC